MRAAGRTVLVLVLVAAGLGLSFAGADPEPYRSVSEVVTGAPDGSVAVKATVVPGTVNTTGNTTRFLLTDGARDLAVHWGKPLPVHQAPDGLGGRTVVVEGALATDADGNLVLEGDRIQVGCPSKYQAEDPGNGA